VDCGSAPEAVSLSLSLSPSARQLSNNPSNATTNIIRKPTPNRRQQQLHRPSLQPPRRDHAERRLPPYIRVVAVEPASNLGRLILRGTRACHHHPLRRGQRQGSHPHSFAVRVEQSGEGVYGMLATLAATIEHDRIVPCGREQGQEFANANGRRRSRGRPVKHVVAVLLLGAISALVLAVLHLVIRLRFPARIPPDLGFEHEIESALKLREVAVLLAKRFPGPTDSVVCLGVARGNAGRLLFHSGPQNRGRNVNIYRPDYVLELVRRGKRIVLRLDTNRPYSYLRLRRSEVDPLVGVLRKVYGKVDRVQ